MKNRICCPILFTVLLFFSGASLLAARDSVTSPASGSGGSGLRVSAVQYEVSPDRYLTLSAFRKSAERLVHEAVEEFDPDIVVFPEYCNVFLALTPYLEDLEGLTGFSRGIRTIVASEPSVNSLRDLFLREAGRVSGAMDRIWGGLARRYGIFIVAGTYFDSGPEDDTLVNRLVVYGPGGRRVYQHDKVYLTPFERDIVTLSPGEAVQPAELTVKGKRLVFTICRSTFFNDWDTRYDDAFLWIDLKANGVRFDGSVRESFTRAIPARLVSSGVPWGLTVCLTGSFMDLFWEGEGSLVSLKDGETLTVLRSTTCRKETIFHCPLPFGHHPRHSSGKR